MWNKLREINLTKLGWLNSNNDNTWLTHFVLVVAFMLLSLGSTVICRPWNFELSCGICPFLQNSDIAVEFRGILQKLRNDR